MFKEFKRFITTGNVLELAVAENGMRFNYISELTQQQMKELSNFFED